MCRFLGAGIAGMLAMAPAQAVDFSFSGFGTLGYAGSDRSFAYQRFIDDKGTLKRDSVLGAQLDARFDNRFGATLQVKAAPALDSDKDIDTTVSWAFLSYRPTNDWLLRAGKMRVPLYLHSENMDVGATFDYARLPTEMYSIAPTTDFTGASFSKSWQLDVGELTLDGYKGSAKTYWRYYLRDDVPGGPQHGPKFMPIKVDSQGFALALHRDDEIFRGSIHHVTSRATAPNSFAVDFPFFQVAPGVGYYQTTDALPGPGIPVTDRIHANVITLGMDVGLPGDFRLASELSRRIVRDTRIGPDALGGYASVRKRFGNWTPYLTYAYLRSTKTTRDIYRAVNGNTVPAFFPGAGLINVLQRAGSDGIVVYDQNSWSLGAAYALSPTSKIKVEWQRAHIGEVSSMLDAPAGGNSGNRNINVFSASYNFVF